VSDEGSVLAYISDYWLTKADQEPVDLVSGADLLLHDSQHLAAEMGGKAFLGHSSVEYVVDLARRHEVGQVAFFHHDPARTDEAIDEIVHRFRATDIEVTAAAAGATYRI
jgi:ribonuclease BN (tRNA processing enzyme)